MSESTGVSQPDHIDEVIVTGLLTKDEVAHRLHLSVRSVDRLRTQGLLPAVRVLNTVRFDAADVERFIRSQRGSGQTAVDKPSQSD